MEKSTKKRIQKVILGATSVALVAGVSAGLTLAYLTDTTDEQINIFTNSPTITAKLTETDWDNDTTGTYDGTNKDKTTGEKTEGVGTTITNDNNDTNKTGKDATWGINQAVNYLPGATINKNPVVTNTNKAESENVAIKLTYYIDLDGDGKITKTDVTDSEGNIVKHAEKVTKTQFASFAEINYNTTNWEYDSNKDIWYYGSADNLTELTAGSSTLAIFNTVTVSTDITLSDTPQKLGTLEFTASENLPKFEIDVEAAVISHENIDNATNTKINALQILLG